MLALPKATEFNKRIPKQKFYENMTITPTLKRLFIDQIKVIYWRNKIAKETMNLAEGEYVKEIEVFEIRLANPELDTSVLKQIDKAIPYHILFLLEYDNQYQAWISYKEAIVSGSDNYKIGDYYHTGWLPEQEHQLHVDGLNMDAVYENFVRQIAGDALLSDKSESLKESLMRTKQRQELQKQISALQAKVWKEKQLNKQVELNKELKILKAKLDELC